MTQPRIPIGRAYDALDPLLAIARSIPEVVDVFHSGALRRGVDLIDEVSLLAVTDDAAAVVGQLVAALDGHEILAQTGTALRVGVDRVEVLVDCVPPAASGAGLLTRTGSTAHLDALRERATARGHRLEPEGLRSKRGHVAGGTEAEIYEALALPFIAPELRNGDDEITAADEGWLPSLVSATEIRGDLHMHSLWSDGRDAIEALVVAGVSLGYEYIAITDHSPNSAATRNLTIDGVERQADEIASLREQYPQIAILHGCEVDILEDGTLDFPDRILERFDIVLASLHEPHGHDPATLLRRYEMAMRHPLVSILTHPTNRLVPHRAGYALDYDRLFALAVETGTLLEIDGAPSHLDLDAALARRAIDAGVTLAIDSDGHRAATLGRQMHLGVVTARRGWVEARHVLNTRPLPAVLAHIAAKRGSRGREPVG